ncbi:MAG: hypothetical protein ACFHVJ_13830 [Aestuariibacter sp.]
MKKVVITITLALFSLLSSYALAAKVKCDPAKYERLYRSDGKVFVQLTGQSWHILGYEGDSDLDKKLKKIRKAERKDRYVQLVFPKGYHESCQVMDPNVSVKKVKLKKRFDGPDEEDEDDDG